MAVFKSLAKYTWQGSLPRNSRCTSHSLLNLERTHCKVPPGCCADKLDQMPDVVYIPNKIPIECYM